MKARPVDSVLNTSKKKLLRNATEELFLFFVRLGFYASPRGMRDRQAIGGN